jgi:hypothetical protein
MPILSYIGDIENLRIGAARGHVNDNFAGIIDEVIIFLRGCESNRCLGSHFEILNRVKRYLIIKQINYLLPVELIWKISTQEKVGANSFLGFFTVYLGFSPHISDFLKYCRKKFFFLQNIDLCGNNVNQRFLFTTFVGGALIFNYAESEKTSWKWG